MSRRGSAVLGAAVLTVVVVVAVVWGIGSEGRRVEQMITVQQAAVEGDQLLAEVREAIDEAAGPVEWVEKDPGSFTETGEIVAGYRLERYKASNWVIEEPLIADPVRWNATLLATEAVLTAHGFSTETQALGSPTAATVVWHDEHGATVDLGSSRATVLSYRSGPRLGDPVAN